MYIITEMYIGVVSICLDSDSLFWGMALDEPINVFCSSKHDLSDSQSLMIKLLIRLSPLKVDRNRKQMDQHVISSAPIPDAGFSIHLHISPFKMQDQ